MPTDDIDPIQDAKHARERGLARDKTPAHTPGKWFYEPCT